MADMGDYQLALFNGQGDFVRVFDEYRRENLTAFDVPPGCFTKYITDETLAAFKAGKARMHSDGHVEVLP